MADLTAHDATPAWQTRGHPDDSIIGELRDRFRSDASTVRPTRTGVPVVWVKREQLLEVGDFLKKLPKPYVMLFDLHGMGECLRIHRDDLPAVDFFAFYRLISIDRNRDIMLKVALSESDLHLLTSTKLPPNANWYKRETWEMFGMTFDDHPNLRRIMMPPTWEGRPPRKDYLVRATEPDPLELIKAKQDLEMEALTFKPEEWGMKRSIDNEDFMSLNFGPNHPFAHGAFRIILQLDGEEIVDCVPDIGYHHRGIGKMGERQFWYSHTPYTDYIEYPGGRVNEIPYVLAVEKLVGITVLNRVDMTRVMLSELFRINNHLLHISTFTQDVGAMTPVFFTFTDRQKIYDLVKAIVEFCMHPAWLCIGGAVHDLPRGWDRLLREFLEWMPKCLDSYEKAALRNTILEGHSVSVATYTAKGALEWGTTDAGLRVTGIGLDVRKWRLYSGYENFDFEVPTEDGVSDCYTRVMLKVEELRQSPRIPQQRLDSIPEDPFKADHPLITPPPKKRTLQHTETLITRFLQVSWGPVMPVNESFQMIEATKGVDSYYLTSDGSTMSYRACVCTPSFMHLQQAPSAIRGSLVSDLIVHLGSIDLVMLDVDR